MKGDIIEMKSIHFDSYLGPRLPREVQLKRVRRVIQEALSPAQRDTLIAYYFHDKSMPQIAQERGVHKSTVCRTLHRAEANLRRLLQY